MRAKAAETKAKEEELLANYRGAVVAAFSDVENALANVAHTVQRQALAERQTILSEQVFNAAQRRYRAGSVDFLSVAAAQRSRYAARDQLVQAKLARLEATIALYKALGGGLPSPRLIKKANVRTRAVVI